MNTLIMLSVCGLSIILIKQNIIRKDIAIYLLILYSLVSRNIMLPYGSTNIRLIITICILATTYNSLKRTIVILIKHSAHQVFALWTLYALISYIGNVDRITISSLYEILGTWVFYIIIVSYIWKANYGNIVQFICILIISYALNMYGRMTAILGVESLPFVSEATRHATAGDSAMHTLPLLFYLHGLNKKRISKIFNWIWVFVTGSVVLVAARRASLAAYLFILLVYKRNAKRYSIVLTVLLLMYMISHTEYASFAMQRIQLISDDDLSAHQPGEIEFRQRHIEYSLAAFSRQPVFGVGYRNWSVAAEESSNIIGYPLQAHNGYFRLLSETGIVGTILFMSAIALHMKGTRKKPVGEKNYDLLYTATISMLAIFILAVGSDAFYSRSVNLYMAIAMGAKLRIESKLPIEQSIVY